MDSKPASNSQKVSLANKRMGLTLGSIVLVFFIAIFLKKILLG